MDNHLNKFDSKQQNLIHILHETQAQYGYIPPEKIAEIARHLNITRAEIFGVLTFYKAFSLNPRGKHLITICMGTACHVRGAPAVLDEFKRTLKIDAGETTADNRFTLETVNCVGACALGPIVIGDGIYHGQMRTKEIKRVLKTLSENEEEASERNVTPEKER